MASAKIDIPQSRLNLQLAMSSDISYRTSTFLAASVTEDGSYFDKSERSKTKAIALSLLLPGAGHFYIGEKGRGEIFMGAEATVWAGAAAFYVYGKWKEDDYQNYAVTHAGVDPNGKDDDFYRTITFYDSREQFNGRGLADFPEREYFPNTTEFDWQWDSRSSMDAYRQIRNSSKSAIRNATFMIGVAVANRLLASIDTFRLLRNSGKKKSGDEEEVNDDYLGFIKDIDVKFSGKLFGKDPKFKITLTKSF